MDNREQLAKWSHKTFTEVETGVPWERASPVERDWHLQAADSCPALMGGKPVPKCVECGVRLVVDRCDRCLKKGGL